MPGQPITRQRDMEQLSKVDEEEVFDIYAKLGSVHRMLKKLKVHKSRSFYTWLDSVDGRRARWEDQVKQQAFDAIDRIAVIRDNVTEQSAKKDSIKLRANQIIAQSLDPNRFQPGAKTTVNVLNASVGPQWLEAMKAVDAERKALKAENEIVVDDAGGG